MSPATPSARRRDTARAAGSAAPGSSPGTSRRGSEDAASSRAAARTEPRLALCRPRTVETFCGDVYAEESLEGLMIRAAAWADRDLHGLTLLDCTLQGAELDGANLKGARIHDTELAEISAPSLAAPESSWCTASVRDSRIGAAVLHGGDWRSVLVTGCKIDFLNLRDTTLQDVVFENCSFRDVDLVNARATRVAFRDCRAETLDVRFAQFDAVDLRGLEFTRVDGLAALRGTVLDEQQLMALAPALARHLGIDVR